MRKIRLWFSRIVADWAGAQEIREILDVQGWPGNWDWDPYMHGLYNGIEMALSLVEDREPDFKPVPSDGYHHLRFPDTDEVTGVPIALSPNAPDILRAWGAEGLIKPKGEPA